MRSIRRAVEAGRGAVAIGAPDRVRVRLHAFLIHLSISGLLFLGLMALVFYWYPGPYFAVDGGWRGTLIMIGVDLVLGPTLTLIVYDPDKERRKTRFDLAVIALLQAGALAWGVHAVESQRPVAVSWFAGAFHPVTAEVVRARGADAGRIASLHPQRPSLVWVAIPDEPKARERMVEVWREDGYPPQAQPSLFAPLGPHLDVLRRSQWPIDRLAEVNERFGAALSEFRAAHRERGPIVLVPFYGRYGNVVFALDADARLVGTLEGAFEGIL